MLKDILTNPVMLTDVYNLSHQRLKVNTDWEVSHIYNRKEGMILYGFAEMANRILEIQITNAMIKQAKESAEIMGVIFPTKLFERVIKECNGYVPIQVQSLAEGTWCPAGTPFAQVSNTVEGFGELVTWYEGIFLHASFPCGTATEAFKMRKYLEEMKKIHGFDDSFLIRLHSFGFRGHRSLEDAYWAGTSWNMFLHGSDDFHTMIHTPNAKVGSIPALAHKVTQQYDVEYDGYIHTIDATAKAGEKIVAIVIDTYDANRFIDSYLVPLAHYAKEKGVHLVIRPDSGDVNEQVVEVYHKVQAYGITNVTAIIGEGMSFQNVMRTDFFFKMRQVPLTFVSYGVGGGFYNHINRDTLGFAMKTAFSNGAPRMKFGMNPLKRSIPDAVNVLLKEDGKTMYVTRKSLENADNCLYQTIYHHSDQTVTPFVHYPKWEETQERAMSYIHEENLQEHILLHDDIHELVKGFEKIYI
ncbi:nicotinamide phosphoribosyltransferase domain-containing protein [Bacillus cereus group sp. BfR-BA-00999]|uniref:nicotinamide phosphoribosyltransferase domain-containing protein n=1 Tax=Bacillus cereus group sp. BfR-BA-00999 TaxID=3094871 RepID=UPI0029C3042C|nr:nicotinamide phosphoribosyltransferase domain-containing protein [Bacillus cereus group sp. BfR-BA-00999]MDX5884986.1 nicotinamide phosphoribosyltransferase domain-containing protein [Bacillus cereus group sp. BfR-BA-00999]